MTRAPVSVVVPCYRCAATIGRALGSVAAQTLLPAEVILVEDGSGDGTLVRLQALAAAHAAGWIRIVALPQNQGTASARNAGWAAATQPYLAFLDADDAWHPRKIEFQYKFMSERPDVVLSGHGHAVLGTATVPDTEISGISHATLSKRALLMSNRFITPSVMIRRDVQHRFEPGRRHVDDHLLWLQLACAGLPVVLLSPKLAYTYKRLFGEGGLSANLWAMERAELGNYWILRRSGCIGFFTALLLSAYSFLKFLRRVLLVCLWRLGRAVGSRSN
jgi:glycosyltransferase involved in cell wall biosynthesis